MSALLGLVCIGNILFQLPDGGVPLETDGKVAIGVYAVLTLGSFFASYWLFRRCFGRQNS
jgi:hypothetical protein